MKSIYLETYGCQMNEADTELLEGILRDNGFVISTTPDEADAILLNTCAVRQHAEERIIGRVGELARFKYIRPDLVIGVLGCMAQHLKGSLLEQSRYVDIVAGPDSYRRLPNLLEKAGKRRVLDVQLNHTENYDGLKPYRRDGINAWVTVQRGCDKVCTFCIVPAVRGRERCLPLNNIVDQVKRLVEEGVREVCLLGQTVNSYRHENDDFADLLLALDSVSGLKRIRFTSPYPTDFTDRMIDVMASSNKIARHIHLPVQSASDIVLKKAKRRYSIEEYDSLVERLRTKIQGLALSTDIIVGFHGETPDEFQKTYDYLAKTRFDYAFMFKYSKRSQTAAWRWQEEVDEEEKGRRLRAIIDLQEKISLEIQQGFLGKTVQVLVEGNSKKSDGSLFGKTSDFRQVIFSAENAVPGDIVDVKVEHATAHTLLGRITGGN